MRRALPTPSFFSRIFLTHRQFIELRHVLLCHLF